MDAIMKIVVDFYIIDVVIGLMGVFGIGLIVERINALYFKYSIDPVPFMAKVMKLVEEDKIDEAITFCAANEKKPLAYVIKRILERADRDDASIEAGLDIAAGEVAPGLGRNLSYLAMVSNVVTLIGLLGTVVGLIMSFKAVSFADPSQKQTLLADGIAIAMHATAAALSVAIPVMVFYSFLHSKQGKLFSEMDQHSSKLIDYLKSRDFVAFGMQGAYPTGLGLEQNSKVKVPGSNAKAV